MKRETENAHTHTHIERVRETLFKKHFRVDCVCVLLFSKDVIFTGIYFMDDERREADE